MRNNTHIQAIPQEYGGVKFRSKNEANFARWCDSWKIRWEYEPEGLQIDNVKYLPDFYLPDAKIIVEIKPEIFNDEHWKLHKLIQKWPYIMPKEQWCESRGIVYDSSKWTKEDEKRYFGDRPALSKNIWKIWKGTMLRDGFKLLGKLSTFHLERGGFPNALRTKHTDEGFPLLINPSYATIRKTMIENPAILFDENENMEGSGICECGLPTITLGAWQGTFVEGLFCSVGNDRDGHYYYASRHFVTAKHVIPYKNAGFKTVKHEDLI